MLEDGDQAPLLALPGVENGEVRRVSLAEYVGQSVVVLCFFRGVGAPGCRPGDCWLQDLDLLGLQRNVAVVAVGPDTAFAQRSFARRANLDMPLLSDTAGTAAEAFGVLTEYEGHRRVPDRAVFVVDDRGRIVSTWRAGDEDDRPAMDTVREGVRSVQSDDSAVERYRRAHDFYRYGDSEFAIAAEAFDAEDWRLAAEAFGEAQRYFEDAADAADAAHWYAGSEAVAERLRGAKEQLDHLVRAARWFGEAARGYVAGETANADELAADAARQRERVASADPMPTPDELAAEAGRADGEEELRV